VPLLLLSPPFSNYSLLVHRLVKRDDRHLLARGILSRFAKVFGHSFILDIYVCSQNFTPKPT
jgi:hypothetical protein